MSLCTISTLPVGYSAFIWLLTNLYDVVVRVAGAEWSFEEQEEAFSRLMSLQQLVVLLSVQHHSAFIITPSILRT